MERQFVRLEVRWWRNDYNDIPIQRSGSELDRAKETLGGRQIKAAILLSQLGAGHVYAPLLCAGISPRTYLFWLFEAVR